LFRFFILYSSTHWGSPAFFLRLPQRKIFLLGTQLPDFHTAVISAELVELTYIGNMIGEAVLAFGISQIGRGTMSPEDALRCNIMASAEDLLDTLGPVQFITRKDCESNPVAISIGGGVICANDADGLLFHWSRNMSIEDRFLVAFNPRSKLIVGALVTVNDKCSIDENACWLASCSALEPLGTMPACWELTERQGGIQAGQYFFSQFNQT
jgi:hypothetical protein